MNSIDGVVKTSSEPIITFGDIEAIISAFGFALGVLFLTKLVSKHSSIEVAGASLLLSGILIGVLLLFSFQDLALQSVTVITVLLPLTVRKVQQFLNFMTVYQDSCAIFQNMARQLFMNKYLFRTSID